MAAEKREARKDDRDLGREAGTAQMQAAIIDTMAAKKAVCAMIADVSLELMMGTMLHAIAVGNLLPAYVKTICVDINPGVFIFFFQAEDGIRDSSVTGVQTCALPIYIPGVIEVCSLVCMLPEKYTPGYILLSRQEYVSAFHIYTLILNNFSQKVSYC